MQSNLNNNEIDILIEKSETLEKEQVEKQRQFREAINLVFKTPEGIILGKWLYETCTSGKHNNDINPNKLIYFKRGEDIYNALKELMTKETIINIELGGFN
ncbi:MAG: hypothetical protein GX568_08775 [Candidatus Gastranaerophilales bacterium]|jgi:hypothetical protein|nr:hypothetical protein [Candidatus Gastranaerophilales bacterium]